MKEGSTSATVRPSAACAGIPVAALSQRFQLTMRNAPSVVKIPCAA
jgi:hypothetical protein